MSAREDDSLRAPVDPAEEQHTGQDDGALDDHPSVLVIDDDELNRDLLARYLVAEGYRILMADSVAAACAILSACEQLPSLILLDIVMPEEDGIAMLERLKKYSAWSSIPVIMLSALSDMQTVVRSIELGAEDHLTKPFHRTLLRVRMSAVLARKRWMDRERQHRQELETALTEAQQQRERAERVLLNILPAPICHELQETGTVAPTYFDDVTIGFADLVGFSATAATLPADDLVGALHAYFGALDDITERFGLEKMKTIGDCYMFAGGIPDRSYSHAVDMILAAREMLRLETSFSTERKLKWRLRIGLHTGPVIAGVVGKRKFIYDIWGESVNIASRMESVAAPGTIRISPGTFVRVRDFYRCERHPEQQIWEGRTMESYEVQGLLSANPHLSEAQTQELFRTRYQKYFKTLPPGFSE